MTLVQKSRTSAAAVKAGGALRKQKANQTKNQKSPVAAIVKQKAGPAVRGIELVVSADFRIIVTALLQNPSVQALRSLIRFYYRRAIVLNPWLKPKQRDSLVKIAMPVQMSLNTIQLILSWFYWDRTISIT